MAIKIRTKKLAKGMASVFFDIHYRGIRFSEFPSLYFKDPPQTEAQKRDKKEKLALAAEIKSKRELELVRGDYQIEDRYHTEYDFVRFGKDYITEHEELLDIRMYRSALNKLIEFRGKKSIPCFELTENVMKLFASFLKNTLHGATPNNYLKKLRRMICAAKEQRFFREDPTRNITISMKPHHIKAVLTFDEIQTLAETPCGNDIVKRAFLFSCITGLRFCDIVNLKWANIGSDKLSLKQQKTKVPVTVALKEDGFRLLGKRRDPAQFVFDVPSHTGCLKWLRKWSKEAHIEKKITWHVARHSFGTNLVESGVDVAITSKLLGHTSLVNTNVYVRVSESLKEQAINKLPNISE